MNQSLIWNVILPTTITALAKYFPPYALCDIDNKLLENASLAFVAALLLLLLVSLLALTIFNFDTECVF